MHHFRGQETNIY